MEVTRVPMYAVRMKGELRPLRYDSATGLSVIVIQIDESALTICRVPWNPYPCLPSAATRLEREAEDEDPHFCWRATNE